MIHMECFQVYSTPILQRHRSHATRNHPENIFRKEYICALRRSLGTPFSLSLGHRHSPLRPVPFPDWIHAVGISMPTSKPDMVMDSLQLRSGMGEFVFWSAQDPNYPVEIRRGGKFEMFKMLDSMMNPVKVVSQAGNGTASPRAGKSRPSPILRTDQLCLVYMRLQCLGCCRPMH